MFCAIPENTFAFARINQVSGEMTSKLLSRSLRVFSVLLIVLAAAAFALSFLLKDLDYYTRLGLQDLEEKTGYRVEFSRVATHIGWWAGLRIDDFVLSHPATGRQLLNGEHIYVRIKLRRLLKKKIVIKEILFEKPQIQLYRDVDGNWHSFLSALYSPDDDEVESAFGGYSVSVRDIVLNGGALEVRDAQYDSVVRLHDCDISLHREDEGLLQMQLTAQHHAKGSRGTVRYTSEFHRSVFRRRGPNKKMPVLLTGALDFSNMPMRECLSYLPDRFVIPFDGGLLDGSLNFDLRHDRQVSAGGALILKGAQAVFSDFEPVSLPETRFAFKVGIDRNSIRCGEFSLRFMPDVYLSGRATIENIDTEAPDLSLHIASGTLNVQEIAAHIAALEPKRFAWLAKASERMSEGAASIHELDFAASLGAAFKPDNISLQARLGVDGLGYKADSLMNFSLLPGSVFSLELERGQLQAQGLVHVLPGDMHDFGFVMTMPDGKARLDGEIISKLKPASISALLEDLMAGKEQVAIAMQQGSIDIKTIVRLDDSLRITSDIDATDAAYSLAGILGKPRGVPNTVRLDYVRGKSPVALPFEVSFGDMLSSNGKLIYSDEFAVEGHFTAKDCTLQTFSFPFLPSVFSLGGSFSGSGDYIFPPKEDRRPVHAELKLDGIALYQQTVEQPLLQVDMSLDFSSGSGPISISDGHIIARKTHGAFEGQLNSVVPLVGTFTAPMDYYDIGDYVQLMLDIVRSAESKDTSPVPVDASDDSPDMFAQMDITVDLTSRQTKYLDWHFGPGRSDFYIKNKQMFWDSVDIEAGGGTFNGSVLYDLSNPDYYRLEFIIDRTDVDVAWAIPAFQEKKTISGRLNLASRFSSNFRTSKELLKNMEGMFDFVVKDGKIEQMTLLSNILNTLNVAQLLAFKMPEYSARGMPFDSMTGCFLLNELRLSTDDLHVKCPSMDFSVAGDFDFNVDELDLLVGVQVFRSVAKVLGSVPYFGKKITGKGKTFTVTYFKAKGSFDQPSIIPIPSRALDNAILKIFKSVWEVPMDIVDLPFDMIRLFSDQEGDNATIQ